jgi:hypothetical protein
MCIIQLSGSLSSLTVGNSEWIFACGLSKTKSEKQLAVNNIMKNARKIVAQLIPNNIFGSTIIRNKNRILKKNSFTYSIAGIFTNFLAVLFLLKKSLKSRINNQLAK